MASAPAKAVAPGVAQGIELLLRGEFVQPAVGLDARRALGDHIGGIVHDLDDAALTSMCERTIRNYDPCISCATHFLTLTVDRR